ncbi:MAG: type II toxin-antitoxin system RelE/ParE family toxin [Paludibacteraceae bacterium]|nr:type II toxin-antitoxin system RelE/ParE family toxin [Paludibacteraceae bacterium]
MRVIWQSNADRQRDQIAEYIRQEFGARRRRQFLKEVRQMTQKLKRSPCIGQIDPLFEDRSVTYRSVIINGLNKLVYRVNDETIHIVAFWDTRMEPEEQAASVR